MPRKKKVEPMAVDPKTGGQQVLWQTLEDYNQVITMGPAGTGKTFLTASFAVEAGYSKIVIVRPHVSVGKELGFLPGTLEEKVTPWALPVLDVLEMHWGRDDVKRRLKAGEIEVSPLAIMRGRSFRDAFILIDEAQNITLPEFKMLLTRVGEDSKIVINGDVQQSDIKNSGLEQVIKMAEKYEIPIGIVEMTSEDIIRSDICKRWVQAFEEEENGKVV